MSESTYRNGNYGMAMNGNGQPPQRPEIADDEISLQDLVEILYKGKWIIAGAFLTVLILAAAYTFIKAPEYDASSMVYVNSGQSNPQLSDMLGLQVDNRNIANEVEILKSRAIANAVAERLMSAGVVPGSGEPLTILEPRDEEKLSEHEVATRLRKNYVTIRPVSRDVDMIEIVTTSTVPAEAAHIANLYAEEYVDYNRNLSRSRMRASREFLSDVTDRFQNDLEIAEEDLTAFLNREKVVAPEEEAKQLIEQVTELQQLQYQTQYELGMAQAELKAIEQEVEEIVPELAAKITSGDDVMIDRLIQQIAELNLEIEQKYARNPGLRENPSRDAELQRQLDEIAALEEELQQRADRMVESAAQSSGIAFGSTGAGPSSSRDRLSTLQELRRTMMEKQVAMSGLQARLDVLNQQLDAAKTELGRIPGKEIVLNRLERSLTTREQLYVTLVEKLQEARIAEQSELGYVDIIDAAIVPDEPVRPRIKLNLLLGAILGMMLGVGLAFVRNAFDNKLRTPEELRKAGISVLSVIPTMDRMVKEEFGGAEFYEVDGRKYSTRLVTLLNPLSPMAEGYRRLASNLHFSRPDNPVRSVVVTSAAPGDGKTSTSLNLAVVFAQMGRRTVYVDCDLRRAAGHTRMDLPREPGIVDLLFEENKSDISRFTTIVDDLYVIPAGRKVPNPSEILESRKLRELLTRLQDDFEVVIIDSPPVLAVADVLSLASRSDATVMVCSTGSTTWPLLERSLQDLSAVKSKFSGVVLNRFDPKAAYGSYGYRYGYGYEYAEESRASLRTV